MKASQNSLTAVCLLSAVWLLSVRGTQAQTGSVQPRPPQLCVDGRCSTNYDLYGTDDNNRGEIPFSVVWPSPPDCAGGLTRLTVTNGSTLATALATPCAEITVAAASYGTLALVQDDQHWILDDGAVFSGFTTPPSGGGSADSSGRVSRIRIEGGVINRGASWGLVVSDLLMENVRLTGDGFRCGTGDAGESCHRVALVHNTIHSGSYGVNYPSMAADKGTDLIIVGSDISAPSTASGLRIQSVDRVTIVDNRIMCGTVGASSHRGLRTHYGTSNVWAARNTFPWSDGFYFEPRADGGTITANDYMGAHYLYDNVLYNASSNPNQGTYHGYRGQVNSTNWPNEFVAVNNITYDYRGPSTDGTRWLLQARAGDTVSGNIERAYQAPPDLRAMVTARGIQPGADH